MPPQRFALSFSGGLRPGLVVLGLGSRRSWVEVGDEVRVRMGWGFAATFPRSQVRSVTAETGRVTGWGVHGWRGRWLVNGSSSGLVRLTIEPDARAFVLGLPVRLSVLRLSLEQPDAFIAAVTTRAP